MPEKVFARVFYAASLVLQEALGEPQPAWDELPAWQQDAMVDVTRRCMVGATPEQLHALWVQHYSAHGWTYGPQKNWETKQHPVILPWQQLPGRYQARFKLWQAIVMTLMLETPDCCGCRSLRTRPSACVIRGQREARRAGARRQPPSRPCPGRKTPGRDRGTGRVGSSCLPLLSAIRGFCQAAF